jgi:conjugative relaxase-like TrwC/TraI family protein
VVISVRALSGAAAADYYLQRDAGCEADYYLDPAEAVGRWTGHGAEALEFVGPLSEAGGPAFRSLLAGVDPRNGDQLAKPLSRAHPAGRLPAQPLLDAISAAARARGVRDATRLFDSEQLADAYLRAAASARRRPFTQSLDPRVAAELAAAAGVDPVAAYRDPVTGRDVFSPALARAAERYDARNSGYDICVSAPKSVSTLFALADPQVAATVRRAHDAAVSTAVTYLEREAAHGLRGHQGDGQRSSQVATDGFVGAAFAHRTSRANDPQLHTHVVVSNLLHGVDGKWSAIDSWTLYRHATTASYVYHAALRSELTRGLGVEWTRIEKGIAEIAGIPADLVRAFSSRREAIENELSGLGRDDRAAAQRACLQTRPAKQHLPDTELRDRWRQVATDLGHDPATIAGRVLGRAAAPPVDQQRLARELTGSRGLTRRRTTVDRRDILQAICQQLPAGTPVTLESLDHLTDDIARGEGMVRLSRGADDEARFSTVELIDTEQHALALADTLRHCPTGRPGVVMLRPTLSAEQRHLVIALAGDEGLAVVVGAAGSGKTAALAAAYRGWQAAGIHVCGTAVSAIAARGLQRASGIPSGTLERVLQDLDRIDPRTGRPAGMSLGSVLVVDEAGMVDTRTFARLLDHTYTSGARLVLVGDTEQLPEIEAGGLFATLAKNQSTLRLSGNVRQVEPWEQYALDALRDDRTGPALVAYRQAGRIHIGDSPQQVRDQIVEGYTQAQAQSAAEVVVLASTRNEVRALNDSIRAALRARGQIGADPLVAHVRGVPLEFAVGDRIMVTRNHYGHGVLNGTRGHVTSVDRAGTSVTLVESDGTQHQLDAQLLSSGDVQHAYAMTVHKAQGITVDVALVSGTSTLRKEASYVALSRGKTANHLYVTADDLHGATPQIAAMDRVQQRLARRAAQHLAISYEPDVGSRPPRELEPARPLTRGITR